MSAKLRQYLIDTYERQRPGSRKRWHKDTPIQIDDQDDNDVLTEFCSIYVVVNRKNRLDIELAGAMPITDEIADLAEIYDGHADPKHGSVSLSLCPMQIGALVDLAGRIRRTAHRGMEVGNPNWHRISARTISSLQRFVRTIREYQRQKDGLF